MPLLSNVGNKTWSQRLFVWFIYGTLTVFGATMAVPFLIMLTSSASNNYDYDRYSIAPRALWSSADRFMKGTPYFAGPGELFLEKPQLWTSWRSVGLDRKTSDHIAHGYLDVSPAERELWSRQAADYSDFALDYPLVDSEATINREIAAEFILAHYVKLAVERNPALADERKSARERAALELLSENWGVPVTNYIGVRFDREARYPLTQQSWVPPGGAKWADFNTLRFALQHGLQTPGVLADWKGYLRDRNYSSDDIRRLSPLPADAPAEEAALWREFARTRAPLSPVIPLSLRKTWIKYLSGDNVRERLGLKASERFDITRYNALAGTDYTRLEETPFPLPADGLPKLQPLWMRFVEEQYPLRLTHLRITPELRDRYEAFLKANYESISSLNHLLGTSYSGWAAVPLPESLPEARADRGGSLREVWFSFAKSLPAADRIVGSGDAAWQMYLKNKYKTLDSLNAAYGWKLSFWEEARMPLDKAYAVTYGNHQVAFAFEPLLFNYSTILRFLVDQGNSIPVTLWLIVLSIATSLTVNPLAGYALSRFNLKMKDKILLFCLATSAFPAMVSAIPGYLLMRDLGMLNTFFALVLPGAASGMSIFILKGFFDSLPQELYEAATIDGAREWQIFLYVTIPMVTPILAINALHAFIAAYDGWAWALIICQDKSMWTLSVWLYQANSWWAQSPWITTAGFVVTSIPTLIVFLFCQKIIMRGIIVPSMK